MDLFFLLPPPPHVIWRGLAPQNKPELQKVMEKRKRDQVIKQQKEEEAQKKKSDLEIELLKRQQKLEQVRWGITDIYTSACELLTWGSLCRQKRSSSQFIGIFPLVKFRYLLGWVKSCSLITCCHLLYRNCLWGLLLVKWVLHQPAEMCVEHWCCLTIGTVVI